MSAYLNSQVEVLPSLARTADVTTSSQENREHRGIVLTIDVTAISLTPSVVFTIQGYDRTSGKWYTILASAAVTATGTTVLRVYPGITAAVNSKADDILPCDWRVFCDHGDTDSITYSLGAVLVK